MTDASRPNASARALIILLGIALAVMLGLALAERLRHPDLTVQLRAQDMPMPPEGAEGAMSIGNLMRQAAAEPQNVEVLIRLVEQLAAAQNWEAAETFAQRAVSMDVNNPKPLYLLGVIMHNQGRHREAAEALEHVLTLKDEASVRYSLGVLYLYFLNDAARGMEHLHAGLEDTEAGRDIKMAIRTELDKNAEKLKPAEPAAADRDTAQVPDATAGQAGKKDAKKDGRARRNDRKRDRKEQQ